MKRKNYGTTFHLISKIEPAELRRLTMNEVGEKSKEKLYNYLRDLAESYPDFDDWFYDTVIPAINLKNNTREIIIAITEVEKEKKYLISGIAILKKTKDEKKICTFRIHEDFRNCGIGSDLFEQCFSYLETRKPIITISQNRIEMFKSHLERYEFEETQQLNDYYKNGSIEFVFNGYLE
jgi:ribosomal protein S18 acetylase RimI-like enzyme